MRPGVEANAALQELLGYLNFSSGAPDPKFLATLNEVFGQIEASSPDEVGGAGESNALAELHRQLAQRLEELHVAGHQAFTNADQARAVLALVFDHLIPAYREYHRDLLFHQEASALLRPFLLGRMFEAVIAQGAPWEEHERIVRDAITTLNDYVGYRPVAVLETEQKIEPYAHEWVRPVPLYVAGAGVAVGRYEALISKTLDILRSTDPMLLARAWFDPAVLDELALDPRAYDFDHPVNKRPNYHFGQWDPHHIDNQGRYRRFVLQQVTLDALMSRLEQVSDLPREELLAEAATVLAGTMLMASGTSGSGPDTHDSSITLSTLLPHIAAYRDEFYAHQLGQRQGAHGQRLRDEAAKLRQPFGGARQHLNQELARLRARQLQHVHLAQLYARMGYPDAATRQAHTVPVASARMLCEMYCRLTLGHRAIDVHRLPKVERYLQEIEDLLMRGIECGALVDPWNIVGFGGNFSVFPAIENSVRDYRVDTLIELMEQIFALCARGWSEAAARDDQSLEAGFSGMFSRLAAWWDQFASSSVSSVRRLVGKELEVSTNLVAGALNAWHKAGAAAGDIAFWRLFVEQFDSPKAFQLVVEALMEKGDQVASRALLMQWLSQASRISLEDGDSSFHRLAVRWMNNMQSAHDTSESWPIARKFFDYLEANAEEFWLVPKLDLGGTGSETLAESLEDLFHGGELEDEDEDEDEELFGAAYDEMTYRDSTADGVEGEMMEAAGAGGDTEYELEHEARRISGRLAFLSTLARLWKMACTTWGTGTEASETRRDVFHAWYAQAAENHHQLLRLLETVHHHRLLSPSGDHDSLVEYDRRRMVKEGLLERIIATTVETADAARILLAASGRDLQADPSAHDVSLLRAMLAGDVAQVRQIWPDFLDALREQPILYVPLGRSGDPTLIVAARCTQQTLRDLLAALPRLGLIRETALLLQTAQEMESEHPVGPGAVTEFDRLFETGYKAIVESVVASAEKWDAEQPASPAGSRVSDTQLVEALQQLTESQLKHWLRHSRTLRLSVVEKLASETAWQDFVRFVERYGQDLFTQRFLNLGNIRAILHEGVDAWLAQVSEDPAACEHLLLLQDLEEDKLSRLDAVRYLTVALEAVVENYHEYRDYNSTTTQSDRGEMLYMFIDFLRLRAEYDRVAWNLRPVIVAHEILVRGGRTEAAEIWRRALADRTGEVADRHLLKFGELSRTYGMRLPTIVDRLNERFIRPLAIDRVRSLVEPAMQEAYSDASHTTFALLEQEIAELAREPSGVGFDLPLWLIALEEEVSLVRLRQRQGGQIHEVHQQIPQVLLSLDQLQQQLDDLLADNGNL